MAALKTCSVEVSANPSVTDVVAGMSDAIDRHLAANRSRTDLGEMAQMAALEAISATAGTAPARLIGEVGESTRDALRDLSTDAGFRTVTHAFFTRFLERYLTYHLSRELSQHVGPNQRFASSNDHNEFLQEIRTHSANVTAPVLRQHSAQVSSIVREFAAGWYGKSRFETGLSEDSARRFASYCLTKIRSEVRRSAQR